MLVSDLREVTAAKNRADVSVSEQLSEEQS